MSMSRNPIKQTLLAIALVSLGGLLQACDSGTSNPANPTAGPTARIGMSGTPGAVAKMPPALRATAQAGSAVKGNLGLYQKPDTCQVTGNDSLEQQVLELVNAERAKQNPPLAALTTDEKLTRAARSHSTDMACNNNLDHAGSNGSSPGDRVTAVGYNFSTWAENVAAGQTTAAEVMYSWMNSEGHRANILNADVTQIGIGYITKQGEMPYWTQVFAAPGQ